ncbi:MAG: murein DD-endopeptidase MepM/ murein hydrolase activator NlpD [Glaciecola sp.]|jgi:murein DD-endopeptidase MepM/ murein hydrolase activator NlpD
MKILKSKVLLTLIAIFILGFLIPESRTIPVEEATSKDWNASTFWYEPWGSSGVHKGIDIFAEKDKAVVASTHQLVLFRGTLSKGGKVILALGANWQLHYYAHLSEINGDAGIFVSAGTKLGMVGDTGNAAGKAPHLHYSILSLAPKPWLIDGSYQGYKKAIYMNPIEYFKDIN